MNNLLQLLLTSKIVNSFICFKNYHNQVNNIFKELLIRTLLVLKLQVIGLKMYKNVYIFLKTYKLEN